MKKEKRTIIAFFALIIKKDKILILRRAPHDFGGGFWDCPGGGAKFGEKPTKALFREIKEESGLNVKIKEILDVCSFYPFSDKNKNCYIYAVTFLCKYEKGKVKLSRDHDKFEWIYPRDIGKYQCLDQVERIIKKYLK